MASRRDSCNDACSCSHECWKPSTEKEIRQRESKAKFAVHNPLRPISTAACLHLSCSNFGLQEQPFKPETLLAEVFPVHTEWEDVHLLPRRHPGLGVNFDRDLQEALARNALGHRRVVWGTAGISHRERST